ncbi:MAG: hypothetical protein C4308_04375 [Chitinophagaceae bacterium]
MKKISTLLTLFLFSFSLFVFAKPAGKKPKTLLTIVSSDRSDIRVIVDGRRFEPNTNYMRIRNMQPGYHSIKIYKERNSGLYTIFGKRYELVFNNSVVIRPQSEIRISIDHFGRTKVDEQRLNRRNGSYSWDDDYDRDRNRDWNYDDKRWDDNNDYDFDRGRNYGDYGDHDKDCDHDDHWGNRDRNGGYGNGYPNNGGWGNTDSRVMSDYDFDRVLNNISRERFESNMMKSAQQIIATNFFTSAQVKQMLQLFSFEDSKLKLAKLAYDKTVDQRNFYVVNEVFSFSSSKDELAHYIRNH